MRKKYAAVFAAVLGAAILSGCGDTSMGDENVSEGLLPSMTTISSENETVTETETLSSDTEEETEEDTEKASAAVSDPFDGISSSEEEDTSVTEDDDPSQTEVTPFTTAGSSLAQTSTALQTSPRSESSVQFPTAPPKTATITTVSAANDTSVTTAPPKTDSAPPKTVTFAEYFSDSLFIGDSICSGLKIYGGLLNVENCAARINVSTWGINKYTFQYKSNSTAELDALSIVELYKPKRIYIWMGMNDLYVVSAEKYAQNLCDLAESYIEASPGCKVYAVSISPMSSTHKWNIELDGNNRINEYNKAVKEKCGSVDYLEYINIHDSLTDSSGYLASANNGGDGIHLSSGAYTKVLTEVYNYMVNSEKAEKAAETTAVTTEPTETTTRTTPEVTAAPEETSKKPHVTKSPADFVTKPAVTTAPEETSGEISATTAAPDQTDKPNKPKTTTVSVTSEEQKDTVSEKKKPEQKKPDVTTQAETAPPLSEETVISDTDK